jgi:hypothetical protein
MYECTYEMMQAIGGGGGRTEYRVVRHSQSHVVQKVQEDGGPCNRPWFTLQLS